MLRTIAVDDEPVSLEIIKSHAEKIPFINVVDCFTDPSKALAAINDNQIDLVFLDIQMPDLTGLEMVKLIEKKVQVVFTTAFGDYAVEAFSLAITDYLLKPISFSRFLQTCQLAKDRTASVMKSSPLGETGKQLFVKDGYQWVRIDLNKLLFIQGQDNYVKLCETDKQTLTRMTLTEILSQLPPNEFVRVEKSYIVAVSKIDRMERHRLTIGKDHIPVSIAYRTNLLQMLQNLIP